MGKKDKQYHYSVEVIQHVMKEKPQTQNGENKLTVDVNANFNDVTIEAPSAASFITFCIIFCVLFLFFIICFTISVCVNSAEIIPFLSKIFSCILICLCVAIVFAMIGLSYYYKAHISYSKKVEECKNKQILLEAYKEAIK